MKKIVLTIAIAVLPLVAFGQSIFTKYENNPDVGYVSISPKLFKMLGNMGIDSNDPEAKEFLSLVNSVTNFKVITTEKNAIAKDISKWVNNRLGGSGFEELMRVRDGGSNVKFYVKEGKDENHVKELLMYVTGIDDVNVNGKKIETVLLSLTGDIDLRQVGKLTEKMDLPGGDDLKKVGDKKGK